MRTVSILVFFSILSFACHTAKPIQQIQTPISKIDSTSKVVLSNSKKIETAPSTKEVFERIVRDNINFTTFSARVKVQYQSKEGSEDATAYVRIKKDSVIWLSLRGPLGIEGFRVLITRDSIIVLNLLKKNVQFKSISYLQQMIGIPFDFTSLQNLVLGNPIFIDSNLVSQQVNDQNQLVVVMTGKIFKNVSTFDNADFKILHSKLDDVNVGNNRSCEIVFNNYESNTGVRFSTARKISVLQQSKQDFSFDFKSYAFNQPLSFPFNIQKNYKRL